MTSERKAQIIELIKIIALSVAIVIPIRMYVMQTFYVQQVSMMPNFQPYNYLIVNRWMYQRHTPQRGDVVVFHIDGEKDALIKRVIGLPGETVEVKNNHVFINGAQLDESVYLSNTVPTQGSVKQTLDSTHYFVMGDNRPQSKDSRVFGPITDDDIVGKVAVRLWPFTKIQRFNKSIDYHLTTP
jgi:signal peptidase I